MNTKITEILDLVDRLSDQSLKETLLPILTMSELLKYRILTYENLNDNYPKYHDYHIIIGKEEFDIEMVLHVNHPHVAIKHITILIFDKKVDSLLKYSTNSVDIVFIYDSGVENLTNKTREFVIDKFKEFFIKDIM